MDDYYRKSSIRSQESKLEKMAKPQENEWRKRIGSAKYLKNILVLLGFIIPILCIGLGNYFFYKIIKSQETKNQEINLLINFWLMVNSIYHDTNYEDFSRHLPRKN